MIEFTWTPVTIFWFATLVMLVWVLLLVPNDKEEE